jgi:ribosome-associated protein
MDTKEFALAAGRIAFENKAQDVLVIDLRGKSPATDFFILATANSGRQGRTIADEVEKFAKENEILRFGRAGYELGRWILADYVDVIVHVFDDEYREYYELEELWSDAEEIKINDLFMRRFKNETDS